MAGPFCFILFCSFAIFGCVLTKAILDESATSKNRQDPITNINLVDGDMLFEEIKHDNNEDEKRTRRSVLTHQTFFWPNAVVPYEFDTVFPVTDVIKNLTKESFAHIMKDTCIKFVKRTSETSYINITSQFDTSCHSFVGRRTSGSQELNLGSQCIRLSVIVHEILHALGFLHEQSRADRDQYVVVNNTNIDLRVQNAVKQFEIYNGKGSGPASNQSIPYDFESVMHYNRFTFSKFFPDGRIPPSALQTRDFMTVYAKKDWRIVLGNQIGLSEKDKLRVNLHYNCPTQTTTVSTTTDSTTQSTTVITDNSTTTTTTDTVNLTTDSNVTQTTTTTTTPTITTADSSTTTATTELSTQRQDVTAIEINGRTYYINKFGLAASSSALVLNLWHILAMLVIAMFLQNF